MYNAIPTDFPDAFWGKVEPTGFCWNWTGCKDQAGYGVVGFRRKQYRAHRVAFAILTGEDPVELTLDHLCRNRSCVNPDHLEPVSDVENTMRGFNPHANNARKDVCPNGHQLPPYTPGGRRSCEACASNYHRDYERERYRANREAGAQRAREYRAKNRELVNAKARARRAAKKNGTRG